MEHFDYWAAFAGTGRVTDYLQYVSHKKEAKGEQSEERWNGTENQGSYYQRTDNPGE